MGKSTQRQPATERSRAVPFPAFRGGVSFGGKVDKGRELAPSFKGAGKKWCRRFHGIHLARLLEDIN
jgi:predicted hydrocarbon binding protein